MKWDSDGDQQLLLSILQTSNVAINSKAIAAIWPKDWPDRPTPRAISERIVKIRANVKARGGAHFSVSGSSTTSPAKGTPRKPAARTTPSTPKQGSGMKRKRGGKAAVKAEVFSESSVTSPVLDDDDEDDENEDGEAENESDQEEVEMDLATAKVKMPPNADLSDMPALIKDKVKTPSPTQKKTGKVESEMETEFDEHYDDTPTKRVKAEGDQFQSMYPGMFGNDGDYGNFAFE